MDELQRLDLNDPIMVAAFEGWNDAADAASGVVDHLLDVWETDLVAEMDAEDYYDFQVNRPVVSGGEDVERTITWPTTRVYCWRAPAGGRDLVLVRGIEPNLRWRTYCDELLRIGQQFQVTLIVTLGALLADTPHTRPIPVSGTSNDVALAERLSLEQSRYEGPTGINGVFQEACRRAGIPAASLWAAVPHYVAQPPCPKATMALLGHLEEVIQHPIPQGDLAEESRAWQRGVDELASEDSEIAEYVEALEEARDTSELPEASGEAIAREFERYLKRRQAGSGDA
ncbi:MAG: PAC2 family protein [Nocardioidaceae bacterium]